MAAYIAKAHAENTLPVVSNSNVDIAYGVGATVGIAMVLNDWADAEKAHADRIKDENQKWAKRQSHICQASRLSQIVGWSELPHTIEQRVDAHHKFVDDIKKQVDCDTDVPDKIVMHVHRLAKSVEQSHDQELELNEYRNVMAKSRKQLGLAEDADGTTILAAIERHVALRQGEQLFTHNRTQSVYRFIGCPVGAGLSRTNKIIAIYTSLDGTLYYRSLADFTESFTRQESNQAETPEQKPLHQACHHWFESGICKLCGGQEGKKVAMHFPTGHSALGGVGHD